MLFATTFWSFLREFSPVEVGADETRNVWIRWFRAITDQQANSWLRTPYDALPRSRRVKHVDGVLYERACPLLALVFHLELPKIKPPRKTRWTNTPARVWVFGLPFDIVWFDRILRPTKNPQHVNRFFFEADNRSKAGSRT